MGIIAAITAFLEAATEYFKFQNKIFVYKTLEEFDSRLDKLDKERESFRLKPDQASQLKADAILSEIAEEKRKLAMFKEEFKIQKP